MTSIETYRRVLDQGEAGDNVGCLLRGFDKAAVQRGQLLSNPDAAKPHKLFRAEVYVPGRKCTC